MDIEKMNDDQLGEYIHQLTTKLAFVSRLPNGSGAVEQLQRLLILARANYTDRMQAAAFKQLIASRPAEINSDPAMNPAKPEIGRKVPKKQALGRVQVRRSTTPISQIDLSPSPSKGKDDTK